MTLAFDDGRMWPVSVVPTRVSFTDLQQYPEDGTQYELYDGELIQVPSPVPLHQVVALNIAQLLRAYRTAHGGLVVISPIDIVFDEYNVLQPDVVFFVAERSRLLDLRHAIRVPPDLAVEVLSHSTAARDRGWKMDVYAREGVPEYWIVDPLARSVEIYRNIERRWELDARGGTGGMLDSATLPGLTFDVARLFDVE